MRKDFLLALLPSVLLLFMTVAAVAGAEEVVGSEKCPYSEGSITCSGSTSTCCSSGQYNTDVPSCIDPSSEQCCLHSNTSHSCGLNTTCCGDSSCCNHGERCAQFLNVDPCVQSCTFNNRTNENTTCPEPLACCYNWFYEQGAGHCYDPTTAQCCGTQDATYLCNKDDTCCFDYRTDELKCCKPGTRCCSGGEWCYDPLESQCCYADMIAYSCSVTEKCCSAGYGFDATGTCCPADTSCCSTSFEGGFGFTSCCTADQTCCTKDDGYTSTTLCCNANEMCVQDPVLQCVKKGHTDSPSLLQV